MPPQRGKAIPSPSAAPSSTPPVAPGKPKIVGRISGGLLRTLCSGEEFRCYKSPKTLHACECRLNVPHTRATTYECRPCGSPRRRTPVIARGHMVSSGFVCGQMYPVSLVQALTLDKRDAGAPQSSSLLTTLSDSSRPAKRPRSSTCSVVSQCQYSTPSNFDIPGSHTVGDTPSFP